MRALKYEGTPAEVALGLKDNGNELVRLKRWKEAKNLYTEALVVLHKSPNHDVPTVSEPTEFSGVTNAKQSNSQQEKLIEEACLINRALCNLELSMKFLLIVLSRRVSLPHHHF